MFYGFKGLENKKKTKHKLLKDDSLPIYGKFSIVLVLY